MKKTIYMFRHGETDWNREGRLQGGTDIPLNETGRSQALRLREFFSANPVEVFLSSDLQRAHETAKIASGDREVPIILEPRLRETNLGEAEGLTIAEFSRASATIFSKSGVRSTRPMSMCVFRAGSRNSSISNVSSKALRIFSIRRKLSVSVASASPRMAAACGGSSIICTRTIASR